MSDFVTKKEFETWKQNIENRIAPGAILSTLILAQGGGYSKPQIIHGSFTSYGSLITFTKAFRSSPTVVAITDNNVSYAVQYSISSTQVGLRGVSSVTQNPVLVTVYWIAIGEST